MPRYANGPYEEDTAVAGSAFVAGDVLMYNATSQLSRCPALLPAGAVVGLAIADSTESLDSKVPFLVLTQDTILRASTLTSISAVTAGASTGLDYDSTYGFRVNGSAATAEAKIRVGHADMLPSNVSEVLITIDPTYLVFKS